VDYGTLVDQVRSAVANDPVDLIETLAQRIADVCLRHEQVFDVEVTVHKPHAPIQAPFDDVALTINRSRS
jgi:dihydroneopterin aldolase